MLVTTGSPRALLDLHVTRHTVDRSEVNRRFHFVEKIV